MKRTSILKESSKLRNALRERWKDLGLSQQDVALDAQKKGLKGINRQGISKYMSSPYTGGALSDYHITWLAFRYGFYITLGIGIPTSKVEYKLPKKFDEDSALTLLKEIFPETVL